MPYVRKTRDIYEICVDYGYGHGFEVVTYEDSWQDAKRAYWDYVRNDTYAKAIKVIKRREPKRA
jgi:hypothetical protein